MTLAVYVIDMLTGRRLAPVPVTKASWKLTTNTDEDLSCTIPSKAPEVRKLQLWTQTRLAASGLLMEVDGLPVAAGPIWKRKYSPKAGTFELTAGGIRSYFERRLVLPASARGQSLVDANGDPLTAYDTTVTAADIGGLAQGFIALAQLWPGGALPIDLGPARAGNGATKTVAAVDLKFLASVLTDLQNLDGGPDIAFRPRRNASNDGIYWELQIGTAAKPRLGQTDPAAVKFRYGGMGASATTLEVDEDGTDLTNDAWQIGGSNADVIYTAESYDSALINAGYPLLQSADTSHSDAPDAATLASYARQDTRLGKYASSQWSMSVRAGQKGAPSLAAGDYWLGDIASVTIDKNDPILGGERDYTTTRRIAGLSGDEKDREYDIAFAEDVILV